MKILAKGIDISRWQGDFDLERAKNEGFEFVIVKGGGGDDGLYKDRQFERNYAAAKSLGMPIGTYWFSRALTVEEAEAEADYFYEQILKEKQFELPVYVDVENKRQLAVGKRMLTDIIKAFCDRLESRGYWAGIYASLSCFRDNMFDSELERYAHWVAQWSKNCDYTNEACLGMWQYGGETNFIRSNKVAGVVCDQNYMLVNYPAQVKAAGLNGYGKPSAPVEETHLSVGDKVRLHPDATIYGSGSRFSAWVYDCNLYVREVHGSRVVVSTQKSGEITGAVDKKNLRKI